MGQDLGFLIFFFRGGAEFEAQLRDRLFWSMGSFSWFTQSGQILESFVKVHHDRFLPRTSINGKHFHPTSRQYSLPC